MKAVRFAHYGEPAKVLTVQDLPLSEPGAREVRVRILASLVNPSDLLFVRGHYAGVHPHFPSRVGFEGVGIVDALGPNVDRPVPGQGDAIINPEGGNWAEYAVVPASLLLPVPDDLADEQVASFFINPATAILMLRRVLAVPRGEWLLQSAAGSELGRMIIRLAKHDGIRTINIVRRREVVAELERLGADAVIVSTEEPIDEQVRKIVGPQGVKYAIDPVVGETGTRMYQMLHEEGRMLVYGSLTGEPIRVGADPRFILAGRRILEVFWLGYWFPRLAEVAQRELVQDIVSLQREGILTTSAAHRFPLDEIGAAVIHAITFVQTLPRIDHQRIGIWGSSYSGGHVLVVGAIDKRAKCVVAQVPTISGWRNTLRRFPGDAWADMRKRFDADRKARFNGKAPTMVPISSERSDADVGTLPPGTAEIDQPVGNDGSAWLRNVSRERPATWPNEITLRSLEMYAEYEPGSYIERIGPTPLLVITAEADTLTPTDEILAAYERAREPKQLRIVPGGHYDIYGWQRPAAIAAAREWFLQHLQAAR